MNLKPIKFIVFLICTNIFLLHGQNKKVENRIMSKAYWKYWNPEVQAKIDKDIDKHRKADAVLKFEGLPKGTAVQVEQISHDFIFGANIFNFNQLGTKERNQKYKALYGTLFNAATIPFYWKKFEMQPNRLRFKEEYWDTEEYWNQVETPELEPHWRRPPSDPVVEFCEENDIRMHGHTITWSNRMWHHPDWIYEQFCPEDEKAKLGVLSKDKLYKLSPEQINDLAPTFFKRMNDLFEKHAVDLAQYYDDRIQSWDVVNESRTDFDKERIFPEDEIRKGRHGLMPGDYTFKSFKTANEVFPKNVLLNINDNVYWEDDKYWAYINQTKDLIARGARIDILGSQMHFFEPQQCLDIADGHPIATPEKIWDKMEKLSTVGLPIHLSEITITSPGDDERGQKIQAVIARNLYRMWFSLEKVMGITWWNVVDGCGAPGETAISGLFKRNMEPKRSFYALNQLLNEEWKTRTTVVVGKDGLAKFRGFKGRYRISWSNEKGEKQDTEFYLKRNGDGI